jgi:16S rRNA (cytosine1402-N4)-methyltransferase
MMEAVMSAAAHVPVMLEETVQALAVQPGGRYIDCTVGAGGHARAVLEHGAPGGQLLGIDADPAAIETARQNLTDFGSSVLLVNDHYSNLPAIAFRHDFSPVHGILFDLGLSSLQLAGHGGFSFQHDDPLDMRFSPNQDLTAADIVNTYAERDLSHIIKTYGEETRSRRIARDIIKNRPVRTTLQLAEIINRAIPGPRGRIHPATRTFQALRIVVNHELEQLEATLKQAVNLLGFEGRLVVISYHSLEDRVVKQFMQRESRDCICPPGTPECICGHKASLRLINRRVITPSAAEVGENPRSRSAKLRAAERTGISGEEFDRVAESMCFSSAIKGGVWRRPAMLQKLRKVV